MQHDEVIWQFLRHNHCSYMSKIETAKFCRNPYNVTGVCNRSSCPLANSRYATIRDHDGVFYLYMKTIERAHMPNKLWERVKLPKNYLKAIEIIDKHMMFWPKLLVHKMKQRLTKMTQMRIRMRKLALKTREKIMTMPRKASVKDSIQLSKALNAAQPEKKIEEELIQRLIDEVYPTRIKDFLQDELDDEIEEFDEREVEYVEGNPELVDEDDMEDFGNYSSFYENQDEDDEDMEETDGKDRKGDFSSSSKSKRKATVHVEFETEGGDGRQRRTIV